MINHQFQDIPFSVRPLQIVYRIVVSGDVDQRVSANMQDAKCLRQARDDVLSYTISFKTQFEPGDAMRPVNFRLSFFLCLCLSSMVSTHKIPKSPHI